jgi:hypothetical protein
MLVSNINVKKSSFSLLMFLKLQIFVFFSKKVNKIFRIEKKVSPHLYDIMQSSKGESKLIHKSSFFLTN